MHSAVGTHTFRGKVAHWGRAPIGPFPVRWTGTLGISWSAAAPKPRNDGSSENDKLHGSHPRHHRASMQAMQGACSQQAAGRQPASRQHATGRQPASSRQAAGRQPASSPQPACVKMCQQVGSRLACSRRAAGRRRALSRQAASKQLAPCSGHVTGRKLASSRRVAAKRWWGILQAAIAQRPQVTRIW